VLLFSCGDFYDSSLPSSQKPAGESAGTLCQVMTDERGSASFRLLNRNIRVPDIIGRSFVVQTSDSQYVLLILIFI
jgi:hypothetical protein